MEETPATALGHLDQEKQGLQSSKELPVDIDFFPPQAAHQTHDAIAAIVPFRQQHKAFLT